MIKTLFFRPWEIAALALGPEKRWYLWQLFASLGVLSILGPTLLLVAAGPLLSSTFWYQYHFEYLYSTLILPVLIASGIVGIARFRSLRVRQGLAAGMAVAPSCAATLGTDRA